MWTTLVFLSATALLILLIRAIRDILFHPLSKYPGPRLPGCSQIPIAYHSWNGTLHTWLKGLHERYDSDVVRVSPHEVSLISPAAWKDVYSHRSGHANFPKDHVPFGGNNSILTANDADHSRMRRLLSHAFSEKALREQEALIESHIRVLVAGLRREANRSGAGIVDMVDWFHWTSFDIIGDLAFGEPFNCLVDARYTPWVKKLIQGLKAVARVSVATRFRYLTGLLAVYLRRSQMIADTREHARLSKETLERRLAKGESRPDFVSYILRHNDDAKGMTQAEIVRQSSVFINAGSQTTATFLCGAVWFVSSHHDHIARIRLEMTELEKTEGGICLQNIGRLKHLQAFIKECHRMYPAALAGLPRSSGAAGDMAGGFFIPGHTGVQLNQYAAYQSGRNFRDPQTFVPERWMGDERYESDRREILQPFAMGPRNCIGKNLANAEVGLILSRLIVNFDFSLTTQTDSHWLEQKAWFGWEKKPLRVAIKTRVVRS